MSKFIASVALLIAMVGLSVLILINGWGLTPVSWAWIIGGTIVHIVLLAISAAISKED